MTFYSNDRQSKNCIFIYIYDMYVEHIVQDILRLVNTIIYNKGISVIHVRCINRIIVEDQKYVC